MSEADFFSAEAKRSLADSVRSVEALTSAEVVVAVRKRSGSYGVLAYHFGLVLTAPVVAYLLLAPAVYGLGAIALDALLAFAVGAALAANFDTLLRALSRNRTLRLNTNHAARASFFDLGISRTSGRNGVLIFVSIFERDCVVLADIGIELASLQPHWSAAGDGLTRAVRRRDLRAFQHALETLGPLLGRACPRSEHDVNELSDEVR